MPVNEFANMIRPLPSRGHLASLRFSNETGSTRWSFDLGFRRDEKKSDADEYIASYKMFYKYIYIYI